MQIHESEKKIIGPPLPNPGYAPASPPHNRLPRTSYRHDLIGRYDQSDYNIRSHGHRVGQSDISTKQLKTMGLIAPTREHHERRERPSYSHQKEDHDNRRNRESHMHQKENDHGNSTISRAHLSIHAYSEIHFVDWEMGIQRKCHKPVMATMYM